MDIALLSFFCYGEKGASKENASANSDSRWSEPRDKDLLLPDSKADWFNLQSIKYSCSSFEQWFWPQIIGYKTSERTTKVRAMSRTSSLLLKQQNKPPITTIMHVIQVILLKCNLRHPSSPTRTTRMRRALLYSFDKRPGAKSIVPKTSLRIWSTVSSLTVSSLFFGW